MKMVMLKAKLAAVLCSVFALLLLLGATPVWAQPPSPPPLPLDSAIFLCNRVTTSPAQRGAATKPEACLQCSATSS